MLDETPLCNYMGRFLQHWQANIGLLSTQIPDFEPQHTCSQAESHPIYRWLSTIAFLMEKIRQTTANYKTKEKEGCCGGMENVQKADISFKVQSRPHNALFSKSDHWPSNQRSENFSSQNYANGHPI